MTSLKQSIIATLTYSDHFDHPLTISEIHNRLIGVSVGARLSLDRSLNSLVKSGKIIKTGSHYHLPGQKLLVNLRKKRHSLARIKLKQAKQFISKISSIPGVQAVYLTGSLAVSSSKRGDDIDLMIITREGRLWTTRLLLTLYTQFLGLRRSPNTRNLSNKLCLNLYLDSTSLTIPSNLRSLYTAYELIQATPIYDPDNTHLQLLKANSWIHDYLPNFPLDPGSKRSPRSGIVNNERTVLIGNFLESLAYQLQYQYMKKRITREHITPTQAFFHPHNPGKSILSKLSL